MSRTEDEKARVCGKAVKLMEPVTLPLHVGLDPELAPSRSRWVAISMWQAKFARDKGGERTAGAPMHAKPVDAHLFGYAADLMLADQLL